MGGLISIVLGLVMIIGGLSGKLVLKGTHSGNGLAAVGAVVLVIGIARFARRSA
jgi:hypothetical protein